MNTAIVYATNSGNTYTVAHIIAQMLITAGWQVDIAPAEEAEADFLTGKDLILLGSSSWDWQSQEEGHLEGHPLISMKRFLKKIDDTSFDKQQIALFGCGDTDFQHFCGAVDHLATFVDNHGGSQIIKPLRVDKFYIDINDKMEQVKAWAKQLTSQFNTKP